MALDQTKNTSWKLGAAGYGRISCFQQGANLAKAYDFMGVVLPVTSGSADVSSSYIIEPQYYAGFDSEVAKDINLGRGTNTVSGNVSFDMTRGLMENIFTITEANTNNSLPFFARNRYLSIYVADGANLISMPLAMWSSFSLEAPTNSLVTGSLSLSLFGDSIDIGTPSNISVNPSDTDSYELEKYWQYGKSDVNIDGFTFACSRSISPVFLNNMLAGPSYYLVGKIEVEITVSILGNHSFLDGSDISFALGRNRIMILKNAYASSRNYTLGSMNGAGSSSYTLKGLHNTIGEVFSIGERSAVV